jgi:hypothetical protein
MPKRETSANTLSMYEAYRGLSPASSSNYYYYYYSGACQRSESQRRSTVSAGLSLFGKFFLVDFQG